MERLTYDFAIGGNHCWQVKGADNRECRQVCEEQEENGCKGCPIALAFDRLAAYEDTGLAPEEIQIQKEAMESMGWFGKMFQRYKGDPRGPIGTIGNALEKFLVESCIEPARNRQVLKDVDGNTWLPMLLDEFESMADVIEHGQEWIPVEERLPEEKQRVIVRCERVGTSVGWILWGNWMADIGPDAGKVTHWMPLPAPPDRRPPEGEEVVEEEPPQTKNDSHKMTIEEYQLAASRTAAGKCRDLANAGLGLTGEAGEVADLIKKHLYQGHDLPREKVVEELGDLMWYIALTANLIGKGMEEIMQANIDKVWSRYPNGFRVEDSIHRKEKGRKRDM